MKTTGRCPRLSDRQYSPDWAKYFTWLKIYKMVVKGNGGGEKEWVPPSRLLSPSFFSTHLSLRSFWVYFVNRLHLQLLFILDNRFGFWHWHPWMGTLISAKKGSLKSILLSNNLAQLNLILFARGYSLDPLFRGGGILFSSFGVFSPLPRPGADVIFERPPVQQSLLLMQQSSGTK